MLSRALQPRCPARQVLASPRLGRRGQLLELGRNWGPRLCPGEAPHTPKLPALHSVLLHVSPSVREKCLQFLPLQNILRGGAVIASWMSPPGGPLSRPRGERRVKISRPGCVLSAGDAAVNRLPLPGHVCGSDTTTFCWRLVRLGSHDHPVRLVSSPFYRREKGGSEGSDSY